eukprot:CAMPEP_0179099042 /NCGR_PEP_ID=MMETSP0796-20121207/45671_1 /TAXON_ID=73915 /ORGANISM="Pyrodinium bahamense, Strain pbaha01" /LENGTH=204 /DNA_ID=CAMNT_0020796831 /DNA_START=111 /DNA_END=725 /DNA_ORIENTATION=-
MLVCAITLLAKAGAALALDWAPGPGAPEEGAHAAGNGHARFLALLDAHALARTEAGLAEAPPAVDFTAVPRDVEQPNRTQLPVVSASQSAPIRPFAWFGTAGGAASRTLEALGASAGCEASASAGPEALAAAAAAAAARSAAGLQGLQCAPGPVSACQALVVCGEHPVWHCEVLRRGRRCGGGGHRQANANQEGDGHGLQMEKH